MRLVSTLAAFLLLFGCGKSQSGQQHLSQTELFELRSKCSALARTYEQDSNKAQSDLLGKTPYVISTFTNRYDPTVNRCYVEKIEYHYQAAQRSGLVFQYRTVTDAQEGRFIVACDSTWRAGDSKTKCTNSDGQEITLQEANATMDRLMGEKVKWPD